MIRDPAMALRVCGRPHISYFRSVRPHPCVSPRSRCGVCAPDRAVTLPLCCVLVPAPLSALLRVRGATNKRRGSNFEQEFRSQCDAQCSMARARGIIGRRAFYLA